MPFDKSILHCVAGTGAHTVNATPLPGDAVPLMVVTPERGVAFPLIKLDSKSMLCPVLIRYCPII